MLFGIGFGFYWGNRSLYSLRLTDDKTRNYFFGLTFSIDLMTGIVVPFLIGWLIVFGGTIAYQILAMILFVIYLTSGLIILPLARQETEHVHGFISRIDGKWNLLRIVCIVFGFQSGNNFVIPGLIVLYLLGNEGVLGTVTALAALLTAVAIYEIGKIARSHHRIRVFGIGIGILLIGTLIFTIYPQGAGIVIYIVAIYIAANFTWSSYNPIAMDLMDQYTPTKKQNRYKYIVDQELFLNIGRTGGIAIFFLLYVLTSRFNALRFAPLIIASLQVIVVYLMSKIVEKERATVL
jgi:YQGE family putative transporter